VEVSDFSHRPLWVWALYRSNYLLHFGVYFLYQDTFNLNILCHESWTIRTFDVPRKSVVGVWALYRSNYLLHFGVYFLYQDTFNLNILCHQSWTIQTSDVPRKSVVVRSVDLRVIHGLLSLNLVPQQIKDVLWRNNNCRCVQKF